jgi:hypothetical protein
MRVQSWGTDCKFLKSDISCSKCCEEYFANLLNGVSDDIEKKK